MVVNVVQLSRLTLWDQQLELVLGRAQSEGGPIFQAKLHLVLYLFAVCMGACKLQLVVSIWCLPR